MGYILRQGLSFCRIGEQAVFLDLPQDRYFCLGGQAGRAFVVLASGETLDDSEQTGLAMLLDKDILRAVDVDQRPTACAAPVAPGGSLLDRCDSASSLAVGRALITRLMCRAETRRRPLIRIVQQLERGKAAITGNRSTICAAIPVAAAFRRAALIMSAHEQCLATSIAAMRMLLARRVRADLVIGVRLRPFQAHCWVQIGDSLVNDRVDTVAAFTPILVI